MFPVHDTFLLLTEKEVSKTNSGSCILNELAIYQKQSLIFPRLLLRGKGPLKNTSDVISAAKKIAEAGSRMDKLGRTIADHVS